MKRLDSEIVRLLSTKTRKKASTVKKDIYLLARNYSSLTKNAVAQIYALRHGTSVLRHLDADDRASLPNLAIEPPVVLKSKAGRRFGKKDRIVAFLRTSSSEFYKIDHVTEINRAYTFGCFTACFVLCRKVVENLFIDVLRAKYPANIPGNLSLYYDVAQRRFLDFGLLLKNCSARSKEFGPDSKLVDRVVELATPFKKEANDRAHSWYYIVKNRDELDKMHVQDIVDLLERLTRGLPGS